MPRRTPAHVLLLVIAVVAVVLAAVWPMEDGNLLVRVVLLSPVVPLVRRAVRPAAGWKLMALTAAVALALPVVSWAQGLPVDLVVARPLLLVVLCWPAAEAERRFRSRRAAAVGD